MGDLLNLQDLRLWKTKLSGERPLRLSCHNSRWHDHRVQYDSNLRITRAHLTGSIPKELGSLVALTSLNLGGTKLEGSSFSVITNLLHHPRTSKVHAGDAKEGSSTSAMLWCWRKIRRWTVEKAGDLIVLSSSSSNITRSHRGIRFMLTISCTYRFPHCLPCTQL